MRQGSSVSLNSNDGQMPGRIPLTVMQERFTASIVTYKHHLLDIEPVLRSLFASPVTTIWIIDHSYDIMPHLLKELNEFTGRVLTGEPVLREKVEKEGLKVVYIRHKNNGYGGGQNVALREAMKEGSRYHLVVNPDVWFGPRVMPALLDYMSRHEDVGQMMPQVLYPNGTIQRLAKLLPTPLDLFGRLCLPLPLIRRRNERFELWDMDTTSPTDVPFLSGCFMLFRMEAIKEVGMFDERFFMYAEDIDITRRMHRRYRTVFYPMLPIYHKFSRASRRSLHLFSVHIISVMKYFNKYGWFNDKERTEINAKTESRMRHPGEHHNTDHTSTRTQACTESL